MLVKCLAHTSPVCRTAVAETYTRVLLIQSRGPWPRHPACIECTLYFRNGDTKGGHWPGACRSRWSFYVPVKVSEMAPPFTWSWEAWEIQRLQRWRARNKSPQASLAMTESTTLHNSQRLEPAMVHLQAAHYTTAPRCPTKIKVEVWYPYTLRSSYTDLLFLNFPSLATSQRVGFCVSVYNYRYYTYWELHLLLFDYPFKGPVKLGVGRQCRSWAEICVIRQAGVTQAGLRVSTTDSGANNNSN